MRVNICGFLNKVSRSLENETLKGPEQWHILACTGPLLGPESGMLEPQHGASPLGGSPGKISSEGNTSHLFML